MMDIDMMQRMKSYRRKDIASVLESNVKPVPKKWYEQITSQMIEDNWPLGYILDYFAEVLNGTTSLDEARDNILSFVPEYQKEIYHQSYD